MNLVEIDRLNLKSAQAAFDFSPERSGVQRVVHLAIFVPNHAALGEHVGTFAIPLRQGLRDHLLRMAQAVDGGRIDPVDAKFERTVNGGDGIAIVLRAPAVCPGTTHRPGAETDGRDEEVRVSELLCRQLICGFIHNGYFCYLLCKTPGVRCPMMFSTECPLR